MVTESISVNGEMAERVSESVSAIVMKLEAERKRKALVDALNQSSSVSSDIGSVTNFPQQQTSKGTKAAHLKSKEEFTQPPDSQFIHQQQKIVSNSASTLSSSLSNLLDSFHVSSDDITTSKKNKTPTTAQSTNPNTIAASSQNSLKSPNNNTHITSSTSSSHTNVNHSAKNQLDNLMASVISFEDPDMQDQATTTSSTSNINNNSNSITTDNSKSLKNEVGKLKTITVAENNRPHVQRVCIPIVHVEDRLSVTDPFGYPNKDVSINPNPNNWIPFLIYSIFFLAINK
jgi:hypothetical protein